MLGSVTALFNMIKQIFATKSTSLQQQTTTIVVKDRKDLKRASNITEELLELTDSYVHLFNERDAIRYKRLKRRFMKVN
jgi:hypothetical protein